MRNAEDTNSFDNGQSSLLVLACFVVQKHNLKVFTLEDLKRYLYGPSPGLPFPTSKTRVRPAFRVSLDFTTPSITVAYTT